MKFQKKSSEKQPSKGVQKMLLKISQNSQENTYDSLFSNKVANLMLATVLKKRLGHSCFPVDFAKRSLVDASKDYFSSHQRNVVYEYKLPGKPTMK